MVTVKASPNRTDRLAELILHVAQRSEMDPKFGATKLNKLLFYADFASYLHYGKSITDERYQKLEHGPAPRAIKPVLKRLAEEGAAVTKDTDHYGHKQVRTIALRAPDYSVFHARDIALVDKLVDSFWDKNATEMSDLSHQFIGWKLAALNEDIPYFVALVGSRSPTTKECEYGRTLEEAARVRQQS